MASMRAPDPDPMSRSLSRPRASTSGAASPRKAGGTPPPTTKPARKHSPTATVASSPIEWLSLTELGRVYGISAIHTGRMLVASGLRSAEGSPSPNALEQGLARCQHPGDHHQALWNRQGCSPHLERQGLVPLQQPTLVGLWADLLAAIQQGSPSISVSAEEMADDMPQELVRPVNRELRQRGCSFQVKPIRRASAPRPACSPAPASDADALHPCG